ncbi:hypothetical protein EHV15_26385 [Paenibacillus oralis]|uniref:Uncharacterized protein n=1 Tax=Paenibacillus oralis TaxID=2490856 RepID=A0A3P3U911_9BACL|nr:hypothetical protein [Paenibacillus oralis]RRJ66049.1 hypothetical protein EHV15_26385 [Paenibacillus oralis]
MKRLKIIGIFLLFVLILSACNISEEPQAVDGKAEILEVSTDLPKNAGWWIVHKDVNTMTINVKAKNIDTVLFWITPTGTETWGERELIGYDTDGSDGWSLTWNFGSRTFHDRIYVQALGSDGATQDKEIIEVTSE